MNINRLSFGCFITCLFSAIVLSVLPGCQNPSGTQTGSAAKTTSIQADIQTSPDDQPGQGQELFASDQAAADALLAAIKRQDHQQLHRIFGPSHSELASGDKVEDHRHFEAFVTHAKEYFQLEKENAATAIVRIGKKNWPFPIPIVRLADGKWFFDTEAGKMEILYRRIGGNELEAIDVCQAYVSAQKKYFSGYHDGSAVLQYAQRLSSKPGTHDGLYWPATADQPQSPFSALAAKAETAGYSPGSHKGPRPFYGYYFHILKQQGAAAPGGAIHYVSNGAMINGFALVAYPDRYGVSGVMTFIVNQQGHIHQKNLGSQTTTLARQITSYNPDKSWTPVQQ